MKTKIEIEFKTKQNATEDQCVIQIDDTLQEQLKKVCINETKEVGERENYYEDDFTVSFVRYKVKNAVAHGLGSFNFLFHKDLIDKKKATIPVTYTRFLSIQRLLKKPEFKSFLTDVMNYGDKKFSIDVEFNGN